MIQQQSFAFKVVISGSSAVGKSSIMRRYCDNTYEENYLPTIGVDFRFKRIIVNGYECKLQIWDTAGQQKFRAITRTYYNNANAVIIVYDLTNPKTFSQIQERWTQQARQNISKNCLVWIVGNKKDLLNRTNRDIIESYANDMNFQRYEVSAKTGESINQFFEQLCRKLIEERQNNGKGDVNMFVYRKILQNLIGFRKEIREEDVIADLNNHFCAMFIHFKNNYL